MAHGQVRARAISGAESEQQCLKTKSELCWWRSNDALTMFRSKFPSKVCVVGFATVLLGFYALVGNVLLQPENRCCDVSLLHPLLSHATLALIMLLRRLSCLVMAHLGKRLCEEY